MQIKQFTRIRNMSIIITVICTSIICMCYSMDTGFNEVFAICSYMNYSRTCVEGGTVENFKTSCSTLLRDDSIYKADPDKIRSKTFNTVEEMEKFVDGWDCDEKINPYVDAYIKQSLWEYADWCINIESSDYWHMKYVASQKTGAYSYARQIKYKWYKLAYENSPFVFMISLFVFVFSNVLCILYGLSGAFGKRKPVKKIPKWRNDCADGEE